MMLMARDASTAPISIPTKNSIMAITSKFRVKPTKKSDQLTANPKHQQCFAELPQCLVHIA